MYTLKKKSNQKVLKGLSFLQQILYNKFSKKTDNLKGPNNLSIRSYGQEFFKEPSTD